jgi:hypothetical protein
MWPFRAKPSNSDILDRLGNLERQFKQLQGEWDDHYDKQRRMLGRIVKSEARLRERDEESAATVEEQQQQLPLDGGNGHHGMLTQRQRELQQQILRRRSGGA